MTAHFNAGPAWRALQPRKAKLTKIGEQKTTVVNFLFLVGCRMVSLNKRASDHQNPPLRQVLLFFPRQKALRRSMGFNAASKVPDDSPCITINANAPPLFCRYTIKEKYRRTPIRNNPTFYVLLNRVKRRIQTAYSPAAPLILNKLRL
ncbi:hypothetical protein I5Q20_19255 [Serratia marcescens]|nr:hypothetical protein [Serratia marcescens]